MKMNEIMDPESKEEADNFDLDEALQGIEEQDQKEKD
jgi:hypothetical protein